jgi:hypothetical protein
MNHLRRTPAGQQRETPGSFARKGGDAQSGLLTSMYDGARPAGYNPMKRQAPDRAVLAVKCSATAMVERLGRFSKIRTKDSP